MPEMRKEGIAPPVTLDVDSLNVSVDPYTSGTVKERSWETGGANLVLPAGAYSVHVRHIDPTGGIITVNGESFAFNRYFERAVRTDETTKKQDFTPEVIIQNPEGKKLAISVAYPSASPVNPDLL